MDPRTEKMLAERAQKMAATPPLLRGTVGALDAATHRVKKNTTAAKIWAAAVIVLLFAAYYVFVTMPADRQDRKQLDAHAAESLKAATTERQVAVSDCLSKAQTDADARWAAACKTRREGANCPLPEQQAQAFERDERETRNSCLLGSSHTPQ